MSTFSDIGAGIGNLLRGQSFYTPVKTNTGQTIYPGNTAATTGQVNPNVSSVPGYTSTKYPVSGGSGTGYGMGSLEYQRMLEAQEVERQRTEAEINKELAATSSQLGRTLTSQEIKDIQNKKFYGANANPNTDLISVFGNLNQGNVTANRTFENYTTQPSNLPYQTTLFRKQIGTAKTSTGRNIPIFKIYANESGVVRNATKDEEKYFRQETNVLSASTQKPTIFQKSQSFQNVKGNVENFMTSLSGSNFIQTAFPSKETAQRIYGNITPTQEAIQGTLYKAQDTKFWKDFVSGKNLFDWATSKGSSLVATYVDMSGTNRFSQLGKQQQLSKQLSKNKFTELGTGLQKEYAVEKLNKIQDDLIKIGSRSEQLKYLNSIKSTLKSEASIKEFNLFKEHLISTGIVKPIVIDVTKGSTIITGKSVTGSINTLLLGSLGGTKLKTETNVVAYSTGTSTKPRQDNPLGIMLGTAQAQQQKNVQSSFMGLMLGTPQAQSQPTKQVTSQKPTQKYGYPEPQIPKQSEYPRYPRYPPYYYRKPKKAYSYYGKTIFNKTKGRNYYYQPSVSAFELQIYQPKGFIGKNYKSTGLGVRGLFPEQESNKYDQKIHNLLLGIRSNKNQQHYRNLTRNIFGLPNSKRRVVKRTAPRRQGRRKPVKVSNYLKNLNKVLGGY